MTGFLNSRLKKINRIIFIIRKILKEYILHFILNVFLKIGETLSKEGKGENMGGGGRKENL